MLGKDEKDTLEVLADKGYYQGGELKECEENNTIAYVTKQVYSNSIGDKTFIKISLS